MKKLKAGYLIAFLSFLTGIVLVVTGHHDEAGLALMLFFVALALSFRKHPKLKSFTFTTMIFGAVTLAMFYPQHFTHWNNYKFSSLITPLLQIIMFGMGCELSVKDLAIVTKMPKAILVGIIGHYTIMPLIGFGLASLFSFPKEIAAGVILVGCCPSGLASNVMSYLARANLALSIAVTAISNLLSPLLTPLLMRLLAGKFVEVHFWSMAWDTTKVVLIPICAGLLFNSLVRGKAKWLDKLMPVLSMAGIGIIIVVIVATGHDSLVKMGGMIIIAMLTLNIAGYCFGYGLSRLLGFGEKNSRTISLEVGMQNSGLASQLALVMGGIATIGVAPAVFGPIMNILGSSLATWWHAKPPKD
jgi:BASS family bile acid:Na+ symporter